MVVVTFRPVRATTIALLFTSILAPRVAGAGATVRIDDQRSLTVALALRSSLTTTEKGAPDGRRNSFDPITDGAVVAASGELEKRIKVQLNLVRATAGDARVMDAILMIEPSERFKLWTGRFLVPADRATMTGPFFGAAWDTPFTAVWPSAFAGRDDGVAAWGRIGPVRWHGGTFRGRDGGTNVADDPLFAGRVQLDLLDPEPGYYAAGTWFGSRRALSIGLAGRAQRNGAGTPADPEKGVPLDRGSFAGWSADLIAEHRLGVAGVGTVEAVFFRYDLDGAADPALVEGDGFHLLAAWLAPFPVGPGRVQASGRWQSFDAAEGPRRTRWDAGLGYVVNGHFTKVGLVLSGEDKGAGDGEIRSAKVGVQLVL